jgi:quercetin 2,3-dioxygenase
MIMVRKSEERRHIQSKSQDTWMTFDPENEGDPLRLGFRGLESLNEERMTPEMGLYPHAPGELDLITYVREGALIHQGEGGSMVRMEAGEFQHRTHSSKTRYRAVNGSRTETAHVFQSWLTPDRTAPAAAQEQKRFYSAERTGSLRLVASRSGRQASLELNPDVQVYSSILRLGNHLVHELQEGRTAWLHVIKGRILLQDRILRTGDGVALVDEAAASFTAQEPSEVLLFDLA